MPPENNSEQTPNYQGQISLVGLWIQGRNETVDVRNNFEGMILFENMFEPALTGELIINDLHDICNNLPLVGEEIIYLDLKIPSEDNPTILVPPFQCYSVEEIKGSGADGLNKKWWKLSFTTYAYIAGKWKDGHLGGGEFSGPIHEFVKMLIDGNEEFILGTGVGEEYNREIEETSNNIYYHTQYADYKRLRKDGPQNIFELINQCAENSTHKENQSAANFHFWQDLFGWKFKSIESLMDQEPVKIFCETVSADGVAPDACSRLDSQIINAPVVIDGGNQLKLGRRGAFASRFHYYRPRIDIESNPNWMISSIDTFYYKVNCRFIDRFPAAIYGFRRAGDGEDTHRWHYAFAEVYLEYDYETHTPSFRIKPLSENPIRSSVEFTEEGPVVAEDPFFIPAHNTMEIGNDNDWDYDKQRGWEAPGMRIDTKMWKESCFKIQPIRGSLPAHALDGILNNTQEDVEDISDNMEVARSFPIVEMKIYKDVNNQPHYFFAAENAADGECDPEDTMGECNLQS